MNRLGLILRRCLAVGRARPSRRTNIRPSRSRSSCPTRPGGATDITARLFGEQLRQILGQQFVVESKPGAFGILAIEEMARAQARRLHAAGRQRLDQCDHAGPVQEQVLDQFREGRGLGVAACDLSVVPDHDDEEFRRRRRCRSWSPTPRRIPARCATPARASAAFRISTWRSSRGEPASRWCTSRTRPAPPA